MEAHPFEDILLIKESVGFFLREEKDNQFN